MYFIVCQPKEFRSVSMNIHLNTIQLNVGPLEVLGEPFLAYICSYCSWLRIVLKARLEEEGFTNRGICDDGDDNNNDDDDDDDYDNNDDA